MAKLPIPERYPHGTHTRYVHGCRCDACREGSRRYKRARARARTRPGYDRLVAALETRRHLLALARQGIGSKAVSEASDVARCLVVLIRQGRRRRVRSSVQARILAVDTDAIADGARVPAGPTRRLVAELRDAGVSLREIGERLGLNTSFDAARDPHVTARTALRVQKLHAQVMAELAVERDAATVCHDCGLSHSSERRAEVLLRLLPCTVEDARQAHPCFWAGTAGERRLYRDLEALGAIVFRGSWALPIVESRRAA